MEEGIKGVEIFFDGDKAGREGAEKVAVELSRDFWVKIVSCPEGKQPDDLSNGELEQLLKR